MKPKFCSFKLRAQLAPAAAVFAAAVTPVINALVTGCQPFARQGKLGRYDAKRDSSKSLNTDRYTLGFLMLFQQLTAF